MDSISEKQRRYVEGRRLGRRNWRQKFDKLTREGSAGRRFLCTPPQCAKAWRRASRRQWSRVRRWLKGQSRDSQPGTTAESAAYEGSPSRVERFNCPSQVDAVPQVLAWLEGLNLQLSAAAMWECRIILVEAFTNAVRHAHKDYDGGTMPLFVTLIIEVWEGWLELQVWDSGDPFDMPKVLESMRQQNEAEPLRYGSGRGLLLMEQVSDRLAYERRGDRNCLIARKKLGDRKR